MSAAKRHAYSVAYYTLALTLAASMIISCTAIAADSDTHQVVTNGPETDPNMPLMPYALPGAPIHWTVQDGPPEVNFIKPSSKGFYLGFNEKGSWIRNENDRHIYVWNIKDRSLTLGADSDAGVPLNLRNPSDLMKNFIANATGHGSTGAQVANVNAGRRTPYIPPSVVGDGNAQYGAKARPESFSPGTSTNGAGLGGTIQVKGSTATITNGVLTFTNDQGTPVSLKVVRPPNQAFGNPNAPKPTGSAGAWLAQDPTNKSAVISLYVTESGAVSGNRMTGIAAEALKRIMNTSTTQ